MTNRTFAKQREYLIDKLVAKGIIRSSVVKKAMSRVPREQFLPENVRSSAYLDTPLPIGSGQTISAPHMVAMMAEVLALEAGHNMLEVGSGSGYHAAVIAEIIAPENSEKGHIYTVEIIPELYIVAKKNIKSQAYDDRVTVILGDGSLGYPQCAPYDRILVTAAAPKVPKALINELKVGGLLIVPVGESHFYQELIRVKKETENTTSRQNLGGVVFVPLTGEDGWKVG